MGVNIWVGEGHLTRDVETRYTSSGSGVGSFGMAVNQKYKSGDEWKEEVCFVDITVWGKLAENCSEYLHKGSHVLVEGRLKLNSWETDTGEKRNKLEVVAKAVHFLDKKPDQGSSNDDIPF